MNYSMTLHLHFFNVLLITFEAQKQLLWRGTSLSFHYLGRQKLFPCLFGLFV